MTSYSLSESTGGAFRRERLSALLTGLLGAIALFLPAMAGVGIALVLGVVTLLAGLAIFSSLSMTTGVGSVIWRVLVGFVYSFSGLYLLFHPAVALTTLTLVLAIIFCFEGVVGILSYFTLRRTAGSSLFLMNGLVTLLLGYVIWRGWPASALWALGTIVGINLIFSGLTRWSYARARVRFGLRRY